MNGFRRQSSPISDWVWMPSYIALWALINNPIILLVALALSWGGVAKSGAHTLEGTSLQAY